MIKNMLGVHIAIITRKEVEITILGFVVLRMNDDLLMNFLEEMAVR